MKSMATCLIVCITIIGLRSARSQTGSDYYLQLHVGNYLQLHTAGNLSGWNPRTTTYAIIDTESISGQQWYKERAFEVSDDGYYSSEFRMLWLAKDPSGNLVIGAVSGGPSSLDSAIILPVPGPYFENDSRLPGYAVSYPYSNYFMTDSTISNTETVNVPAGTFTNCIEKVETHYDSLGSLIFREYHYFAFGVGMVKNVRDVPVSSAHVDELVQYAGAPTSAPKMASSGGPESFRLYQNYPNPFNPSTKIRYMLPASTRVRLTVYNALGQEVAQLVQGLQDAGYHEVTFDAAPLAGGVYFCRITANAYISIVKMLLIK